MDEKDLNENEEKLTDVNNDSVDSGLEEKDGVKYETSDNWEFDAKARRRLMKILLWKIKTIQFHLTK